MAEDDDVDFGDDDLSGAHTFLTFAVGDELYAVSVQHVTEIVRLPRSFSIPDVPAYVRGVINLRGKVIPLLDMRARLGMPQADYSDRTVVVVIEQGETMTGLVVDAVSEVMEIPPEAMQARRAVGVEARRSMVLGMTMREEQVVFVLDLETVLSGTDSKTERAHEEPLGPHAPRAGV